VGGLVELRQYQKDAIRELDNGKILYGGVGAGKSATTLGYYVEKEAPRDIIVITTAKKRDSLDWINEALKFGIFPEQSSIYGSITVDSWNNIDKYVGVKDAFFVFDEQRLVGNGVWVKSFLKIAKENHWILLSATPGDTWLDYVPVFIANGFFKNVTEFKLKHVQYEAFRKFPVIRCYLNVAKLELLRNHILVEMPYMKHTKRVLNWMDVNYDKDKTLRIIRDRWNPFEDRPCKDIAEVYRLMRRVTNSDTSRLSMIEKLMRSHPKLIVFYNFDYELEILRLLDGPFYNDGDYEVGEWNGHRKNPVPSSDRWVYLVQYVAGAEAWECIETDAMVLYSLPYSYKNFEQAQGRIDRMNTPFKYLYYYLFLSNSEIDRRIKQSLENKEDFNERKFIDQMLQDPDLPAPF
jgi:hypothetical protein